MIRRAILIIFILALGAKAAFAVHDVMQRVERAQAVALKGDQ